MPKGSNVMDVMFFVEGGCQRETKYITVREGMGYSSNCFDSLVFYVDLYNYVDSIDIPRNLYNAIKNGYTPKWYSGEPFSFVKETIEGQELLERTLSEYGISYPISLPRPKTWANGSFHIEETKNSWTDKDIRRRKEIDLKELNMDVVCNNYDIQNLFGTNIYTIKCINIDNNNEIIYVGKSTNFVNRLRRHVSKGGDFSYVRDKETVVSDLMSVKPQNTVSESEQYDIMKEKYPNKTVCGGR